MLSHKIKLICLAALATLLTSCSTMYNPLDTLYWHGKEDYEFFARKRLPDESYQCFKDNEKSYIHAYRLALYDLQTYEVGRNARTIFLTTEKYILVVIHGLMYLRMQAIKSHLLEMPQGLVTLKKNLVVVSIKKQ